MNSPYSAAQEELSPYSLTAEDFTACGRLVVACAQLEEIVNHWLCALSGIAQMNIEILLGKMPISSRLKLAKQYAEIKGAAYLEKHVHWFEHKWWKSIIDCRNAVCHGVPIGQDKDGNIAFKTTITVGQSEGVAHFEILKYGMQHISYNAKFAEDAIPNLIDDLGIASSLQKSRPQLVGPHPKTSRQRQPTKARDNPPESFPR